MSCLALSLQPINGPDILLQTREWFPPARALIALSAFRNIRLALSSKNDGVSSDPTIVGDDPLAASSGQLIVGVESRYRVVYRLVNSIYVLGVTTLDNSEGDNNNGGSSNNNNNIVSNNVFECISIVNQAVSVVVTACRGVDVTAEKLGRKYAEVYMALDIVLRGVSNIRLAAMLAALHGESIAKMVHSGVDSEGKVRGGESWGVVEAAAVEHEAGVEVFEKLRFELDSETISAGDEVVKMGVVGGVGLGEGEGKAVGEEEEEGVVKDPFAASERVNEVEALVGDFKKDKEVGSDLSKALVGLEVTTLPPAEAAQPTRIAVEGFEGDYGGIEFGNEEASLRETFEGFSDAFGGGLDVSEFVGTTKVDKREGLGGLELLQTGPDGAPVVATGAGGTTPLDNLLVDKAEMKGPEMFAVEEINAEFRESLLARIGLKGVIYLRTLPPKTAGDKETEFSFKVDEGTTNAVKRTVVSSSLVSSIGNGMFHVRTPASEEPLAVMKYSLMPQMTPIPLRVRLVQRHVGTLLSVMIQYVSNPDLPAPLTDVTFILKLPVDPTLLKVSPKAVLNRSEKELKWHVQEIPLKGTPGKLRARMPVDINEEDIEEELDVVCYVKFSIKGPKTLSGVSISPAYQSDAKTDFYVVDHKIETGVYMSN